MAVHLGHRGGGGWVGVLGWGAGWGSGHTHIALGDTAERGGGTGVTIQDRPSVTPDPVPGGPELNRP